MREKPDLGKPAPKERPETAPYHEGQKVKVLRRGNKKWKYGKVLEVRWLCVENVWQWVLRIQYGYKSRSQTGFFPLESTTIMPVRYQRKRKKKPQHLQI